MPSAASLGQSADAPADVVACRLCGLQVAVAALPTFVAQFQERTGDGEAQDAVVVGFALRAAASAGLMDECQQLADRLPAADDEVAALDAGGQGIQGVGTREA